MPKVSKTKKELQVENAELTKALSNQSAVANESNSLGTPVMVPVKNFSTTYIVHEYEYRGQPKRLDLDISGKKSIGALPLEIWLELERDTVYVDQGYIARTDMPITNPNVIEDAEKLVDNLTEEQFAKRVSLITNASTLYRLVGYLEPIENKTGKLLSAQRAVRNRVFELTKTRIVDMES